MTERQLIYLTLPVIAAAIGWITNYIAVKMIFRPRRPIKILGFTFFGLIPRRQHDLALSIGEIVEEELVSHEDVQRILESEDTHKQVFDLLESHIDKFLKEKLGQNPMLAMFLQGEMGDYVKAMLLEHLSTILPEVLESLVEKVESELNFKELISQKVEQFDLSKLEDIIYKIASKELKSIEVLGALLGFLVGLAQVALLIAGGVA